MFLICGEALFDVFVGADTGPGAMALEARVGGSPFNVSIGMARLGTKAALLTGMSSDLFGDRLRSVLTTENVDTRYLVRTGRRTTLSVVGLDHGGSPSYSFYGVGSADCSLTVEDVPELDGSITGLHFGSYSIVVSPVADAFEALAKRNADRFISLDPNVRPTVEPDMGIWRHRIDVMRQWATLIKVSDEDLSHLYPGDDPVGIAMEWARGKAELVVLTRGASEVVAIRGSDITRMTPPRVTAVDTVGAGDSFQAALLSGLASTNDPSSHLRSMPEEALTDLLAQASRCAAITCQRRGADLPTRAELM